MQTPSAAWNYYRFRNNTQGPATQQSVSGLYFGRNFGPDAVQTVSLDAGETKDGVPFDERFWDLRASIVGAGLTSTGYLLKGLGMVANAVHVGCSLANSPLNPNTNVRITLAAGDLLTPAQVAALNPFTGNSLMIITMADTPWYAGPQTVAANGGVPQIGVDGGGNGIWVEFFMDATNGLPLPDLNNGIIQVAFSVSQAVDPTTQVQIGVAVRATPIRNPSQLSNYSLGVDYKDDTHQFLGEGSQPRHSGVLALCPNGEVVSSHGSEHPFCEPFASQSADLVDTKTNKVLGAVSNVIVPGFDRGFTYESILCPDGRSRVYVAGGYQSNDEVLNASLATEAYDCEARTWGGGVALHYQFRTIPVGGVMAFGPNDGPSLGMIPPPGGYPALGTTGGATLGKIVQPTIPSPGGPGFPPAGQYSFTTASFGPFPNSGFDFGQLFADSLTQDINTAVPGATKHFSVSPAAGTFNFFPGDANKKVMLITPYRITATDTAGTPGPLGANGASPGITGRIRTMFAAFENLPDGRVITCGGYGSNIHPQFLFLSALNVTEILDPATGVWTDVASMPVAVANEPHGALVHSNGKLYCFGGLKTTFLDPGGVLISADTQIYDPVANSWALGAPHPMNGVARACRPVELPDGRILVAGGTFGPGPLASPPLTPYPAASPRCFVYDPVSDSWDEVGQMVVAVQAGWIDSLPDGRALMIGGSQHAAVQGDRELTQVVQVYSPATESWKRYRNIPGAVGGHWYRHALVGSKVLEVGGIGSVFRNSLVGQPLAGVNYYCPPRI